MPKFTVQLSRIVEVEEKIEITVDASDIEDAEDRAKLMAENGEYDSSAVSQDHLDTINSRWGSDGVARVPV